MTTGVRDGRAWERDKGHADAATVGVGPGERDSTA